MQEEAIVAVGEAHAEWIVDTVFEEEVFVFAKVDTRGEDLPNLSGCGLDSGLGGDGVADHFYLSIVGYAGGIDEEEEHEVAFVFGDDVPEEAAQN